MRYTIVRDQRVPRPRKLAWAVVGLGCVLTGSAALGWQNSSGKLRTAVVEEVESDEPPATISTPARPTPAPRPAATTTATAKPAVEPIAQPAPRTTPSTARRSPTSKGFQRGYTSPSARTAAAPSQRSSGGGSSILGIPLPSFGRGNSDDDEAPAETPSTAARPRAGSKALGTNANPRTAPKAKPRAELPPEEEYVEVAPPPTAKQPRVAQGSTEELEIELPPVKAKPAPRQEQPTTRIATTKVAEAPDVRLPKTASDLPRKLAPLAIAKYEDVRAAGFQNVTPGETKLSGVAQSLGSPATTERDGETTIMTYQVGPFPRVEVILAGDIVDSIIIYLKEAAAEKAVLAELGLNGFTPVDILDENGAILGRAVPERGVALSYQGDAADRMVGEVVLGSVTAEPFVLRALGNNASEYEKMLADAKYAETLDPNYAEAFAIQARIHLALGRFSDSRRAIEKAIQLDSGASDYRLLYARLLSQSGDYANALKMTEAVATTASVPPEFVAEAELLWGDLLSHGPERDYPGAIEHHTKAIKLATALAEHGMPSVRRAAQLTLIEANLAVARDVALGNYKRKSEVVPKWISKAESFAQQAIEDGADDSLQLQVAAKTLSAYACLIEPLDPTEVVEDALATGQDLIGASQDALHKQQLEWTLGCALLDAVQIEHARGEFDTATQYANNALALLKDNVAYREATPHRDYVMGRMYFAIGALYAVGKNDHAEAVHYYLQAIPSLEQPLPDDLADEQGRHAERFVSMGVSFWQNGNKSQAVEVTLAGANLLKEAVDAGQVDTTSLAVPYSNLAAMYKQLGNSAEAKKFGELASRVDETKPTKR